MWSRAKAEANLKSELKMKVVWNICSEELDGEMKFVNENCFKSSLENFQKSLRFRETYVKYIGRNSTVIVILL